MKIQDDGRTAAILKIYPRNASHQCGLCYCTADTVSAVSVHQRCGCLYDKQTPAWSPISDMIVNWVVVWSEAIIPPEESNVSVPQFYSFISIMCMFAMFMCSRILTNTLNAFKWHQLNCLKQWAIRIFQNQFYKTCTLCVTFIS